MRWVVIILSLAAIGIGAWALSGGIGGSVEDRIEDELITRGLPEPMAICMAERMADRLSLSQLRNLERLQAEEGEADLPMTMPAFLERVRRVDDPEVIEVTASSAAICAFGGL